MDPTDLDELCRRILRDIVSVVFVVGMGAAATIAAVLFLLRG